MVLHQEFKATGASATMIASRLAIQGAATKQGSWWLIIVESKVAWTTNCAPVASLVVGLDTGAGVDAAAASSPPAATKQGT